MITYTQLEKHLINRAFQGIDGKDWYAEAYQWCAMVAARHGLAVKQVAGIVAALSPQRRWDINRRHAIEFIESNGEAYVHYGRQIEKARAIFRGEDPKTVLSGPKVTCFYENIMGNTDVVTMDRHMINVIGYGKRKLTKKRYRDSLEIMGKVSQAVGLTIPQTQAAIWATLAEKTLT